MNAYDKRVRELEAEGLTTSDAQGVADAEILNASRHTPELCQKCQWEHTADSVKGTSFMGVRLCPLHATAPNLLAALAKCVDALLNVPVVGGIYDQQHSDTHMRATLDARAAIAIANANATQP